MRLGPVILIALVAPAFAGCMGDEPVQSTSAGDMAAPEAVLLEEPLPAIPVLTKESAVEAPVWKKGDAWVITNEYGGVAEAGNLVVASADATSYTIVTTTQGIAEYDAMFDVSYVGRIRASDLAGHQLDQPVQFFSFPLTDGKTWTTTWDGLEVALTATFAPSIPTPLGAQPGFTIVGTQGGAPYVTYDYVPALKWWSQIHWAEGYGFKVDRKVENWTGSYLRGTATQLMQMGGEAPVGSMPAGAFTVDEEQTSLHLFIAASPTPHARGLLLVDPNGTPIMTASETFRLSPEPAGYFIDEPLPPTPGEWHVVAPAAHEPGGGVFLFVKQVKVEMVPL